MDCFYYLMVSDRLVLSLSALTVDWWMGVGDEGHEGAGVEGYGGWFIGAEGRVFTESWLCGTGE